MLVTHANEKSSHQRFRSIDTSFFGGGVPLKMDTQTGELQRY
jgi:hypothetical protein